MRIVTGPSFTNSTDIIAWKMPVATFTPSPRNASQNSSYNFLASSGGAAEMKLGRRCPRASPYSVNCDTTSASPFTSSSERFIFPCSSSKIRRLLAFSAIPAATPEVSSLPTPSRIISPAPISPVARPSTVTFARLTLCTTSRIILPWGCSPPQAGTPVGKVSTSIHFLLLLPRLPRQHLRQLCHVVPEHCQHFRALRQFIPPHAVQRIRLRVMRLVVVRRILHAPETRHSRLVKRYVVRSSLASQRRLHDSCTLRQWIQNAVHRFPHVVISHQSDRQHFPGSSIVHQHTGNLR